MPIQKTTVEEILKHSIRVFRQKGYYRTNMSDLAQATGLTKGIFYHHFANKAEVMQRALAATTDWFDRRVFRLAYDESLTPGDRLAKMAEATFRAFTDDQGGCFFANTILETANVEETFLPEIRRFFAQWQAALHHLFAGQYPPEAREGVVSQTIADIEGSIVLMQLYKNPDYLRQALQRATQRFEQR
jgi:TetR/AcrR family transcriptional regulator, transcriptional repressor for nem operon